MLQQSMVQQVLILNKQDENMQCLYDTIVENIPAPIDNREEPLQFQVALA